MKFIVSCALALAYVQAITLQQEADAGALTADILADITSRESAVAEAAILGDFSGVGLSACWIGSGVTGSLDVSQEWKCCDCGTEI